MNSSFQQWNTFFSNKSKYHNLCISIPLYFESQAKIKLIALILKQIIEEIKKINNFDHTKFLQTDILNYAEIHESLSVKDLEEMDSFLSFAASYLPCKIVFISGIKPLSTVVANKILKYLEEPPVPTSFIMIGAPYSALLPTVRSRFLNCRLSQSECLNFMPDLETESNKLNILNKWKELKNSIELEQWAEENELELSDCLSQYWNLISRNVNTAQEIDRFISFQKWHEQSDIWHLPKAERWYFLFQMIKSKIQSITN